MSPSKNTLVTGPAVIIGRPNVGKSTFFNRMTGSRHAIVDDQSGITRDRLYGDVEWTGKVFTMVDTGGLVPGSKDVFEAAIRKQVVTAMDEAPVLLFMVDCTMGITGTDEQIAALLRKSGKPVLVVANKADNHERLVNSGVFYKFGLGEVFPVSSVSGSGTGELLDRLAGFFGKEGPEKNTSLPRLAILGRPNVGKSSFLNALLGYERNIVTDVPGTTRDAVLTPCKFGEDEFMLTDTAGIRKKAKVKDDVEFYSVLRAIRAIESSDVCFILLDAREGMEAQDVSIISLAIRRRKGIVILMNKWDLVEKNTGTAKEAEDKILHKIAPFTDVPIICISAKTGQRLSKAVETGMQVYKDRNRKLSTSALNRMVQEAVRKAPPPSYQGREIRIKYATQVQAGPPVIAFFCNHPTLVREPYKRYLENRLREAFRLTGVPVTLTFRQK